MRATFERVMEVLARAEGDRRRLAADEIGHGIEALDRHLDVCIDLNFLLIFPTKVILE